MSTTSKHLASAFTIRPATDADLPSILTIYKHYVLNTTIAFLIHEPHLSYISERYEATKTRGLPYLVAVSEPKSTSTSDPDSTTKETEVLGYAHASPFKPTMIGYAPSVEITIFLAPAHTAMGVGSALMTRLLDDLRACKHVNWEAGHDEKVEEHAVRNVFAVMSQDVGREGARGEEAVAWYQRFGFRLVGRMEKVGCKFGREIDVVYLQKRLE
ncbi:hypothetical protein H2198_005729 [Neophaeococcomyces mojaviensis]|uniref:Uncharacterized protein n=1 Tax=Neophaeococcomyces mojaviensis TaxID=3383035 RepID=A0ACC3A508_9EURO|nr:hypothetical protein H2198_005729 [Knufia sp. JES_112]